MWLSDNDPLWNPLNEVYRCPNLTLLVSLCDCRYVDFHTGHFVEFESAKSIVTFPSLGSQNLRYLFIFTDYGQVTVILLTLGKTLGCDAMDLAQVIFYDSIKRNQELGSSVSK